MTTCANCGQERADTVEVTLWTALETTRVTPYVGSVERQTATTYEDYREHKYAVCRRCLSRERSRPIAAAGIYAGLMLALLLVIVLTHANGAIGAIVVAAGGALAFGAALLFTRRYVLPRLALAERRAVDPRGRYKVFNVRKLKATTRQMS
ncbi:MAG: hypothetical protein ACYC6L_03595 [Anaerolineae bacterium]